MLKHFIKRPVEVVAIQFHGSSSHRSALEHWMETGEYHYSFVHTADMTSLIIHTLEGDMKAMPGDWVVKGVKGEFYPVKPDIFDLTYEEVLLNEKTKS